MIESGITPPPELVQQWRAAASNVPATLSTDPGGRRDYIDFIAACAAQWGADQELEACCECIAQWYRAQSFLKLDGDDPVPLLRIARRPKSPSLVEEALVLVQQHEDGWRPSPKDWDTIRRALERLQELEGSNE